MTPGRGDVQSGVPAQDITQIRVNTLGEKALNGGDVARSGGLEKLIFVVRQ